MFKLFAVAVMIALSGCASANNYEEMYQSSFVVDCRGYICVDQETGEVTMLDKKGPPRNGSVVKFTHPYTIEEIKAAMPYILKRYRGEE